MTETTPAPTAPPAGTVPAEPAAGTPGGWDEVSGTRSYDARYPQTLTDLMRTGWLDQPVQVNRRPAADHHVRRRATLAAAFPGETLVVPTGRDKIRANDTPYPFRPGSDFVWLTGDHDPGSVLVLGPDGDATLYTWAHAARDSEEFYRNAARGELWVGRRATLAEKAEELGVRTAPLDNLPEVLGRLAPARTRVLRGYDTRVDASVLPYDTGEPGARDQELAQTLSELRLPKDEWELAALQEAIDATVRGFEDVARALPADRSVSERLIEGIFGLRARHDGNAVGYASIVGAGAHATTLHWVRNTGFTVPGELLLLDMGVEGHSLYTADVTRVWPVDGHFSPAQRDLYALVYEAQEAGIAAIAPGVRYEDVALACNRVLAEGLYDLKLLRCSVDEALDPDNMSYRRWTLHGFGHMLGLDVHDCAAARPQHYRDGTLELDHVLTVEPGLYFQPDDDLVPEELRGLGIRIEDDVHVTATGARVLSAELPRAPHDVQTWLATQREAGPRLPA